MQNENKIRLRDRREPGHLWADNEIYDVFGDELGAPGIALYMTLARLCYGSSVKKSLRDLGEHARMGKDAVSVAMRNLVRLGLVIETKSERARVASTYSLTNVKELAREYVSKAVRQTVCGADSLEACKNHESLGTAREMTYFEAYTGQPSNCLTGRQLVIEAENQEIADPLSAPQTNLSEKQPKLSAGKDAFNKTQETRLELLPPTPFQGDAREPERVARFEELNSQRARHGGGPLRWDDWLREDLDEYPAKPLPDAEFARCGTAREAANLVAKRCSLVGERIAKVIEQALAAKMVLDGSAPGSLGELAWRRLVEYQSLSNRMRFVCGPRKFFLESHWLLPDSWPLEKPKSRF